jgi:hypothetical protein
MANPLGSELVLMPLGNGQRPVCGLAEGGWGNNL